MEIASTTRQRFLRVCREFETSRLEDSLLAAAYERAVPTVSRRVGGKVGAAAPVELATVAQVEMDFPTPQAKERQAG